MRILLSHVYAWPEVRRGGERYLHELAAALQAAGHEVRILTTAPRPGTGTVLGVPVTYLRRRRLPGRRWGALADELAFGAQALAWAARRRFDVWHALGTADAFAAAQLGRVRRLRTVYTQLGFPAARSREARPDRRLHRGVVRRIDHYVCLSEATGAYLRDDYGREPVVLGGGVDLDRFAPGPRSPHPTILFTGAVGEPRKNFPLLLEALALLRDDVPDVRLVLSAPGDPAPVLAAAPARARDAVDDVGVGRAEALGARYASAWVTALPSEHEAFGLVVLESLASGTPVVTLDRGGAAELVDPSVGRTAPPEAAALAGALREALTMAADPGTAARCRAKAAQHTWQGRIVPALEERYR